LEQLKLQTDIEWPVRYDDMFPYADKKDDYWTGYFTSRALAKRMDRVASSNLLAANQFFALKVLDSSLSDDELTAIMDIEQSMLDMMGVMQHHDAITGTARQKVADNYQQNMSKAYNSTNQLYMQYVNEYA